MGFNLAFKGLIGIFLVICNNRVGFFPDADILDTPNVKVKVKVKGKIHPVTGHEFPDVEYR
jgi:hypothetical protein